MSNAGWCPNSALLAVGIDMNVHEMNIRAVKLVFLCF
jgi:hypothetical protein